MTDPYQALMEKLDQTPTGAPKTEHLEKILKILFTEEEAKIASQLPLNPLRQPISKLAEKIGMEKEKLEPVLENLADKGLVYCAPKEGEKAYALLPLFPGIFELQFMRAEYDPKSKALAKLFNDYYFHGWGKSSLEFKTPFTRTIPIEKAISPGQQVASYQKVEELITDSKSLAITNCFCRHEHELLGDWCGRPKEVCMILGPFADFAVERGFARRASRSEMLEKLQLAEEKALVHITDNIKEKINFICNCCGCCCGFLTAVNKLNIPSVVASSGFMVEIDEEKCNNCGACTKRCQVRALWLEEDPENPKKKILKKNLDRCIGCGLCVSACKQEAMKMVKRPEDQIILPRESFWELGMELLKEKAQRKGGEI